MKPSVHLQHVESGQRWVCCCTGEPWPGSFMRLGCGDFSVGRHADSDIRLLSQFVSRHHAILRVIDTRLYFEDQNSRGGTRVNDRPRMRSWERSQSVEPFTNWIDIRPADVLHFGGAAVRILWVGEGLSPFTPDHLAWNDGTVVRMARAIAEGACHDDLPILADALEEAGCTDAVVLSTFRKGERSATSDYLLEHLLDTAPPATIVQGRPLAKCPLPRDMPDSIACDNLSASWQVGRQESPDPEMYEGPSNSYGF